MANLRDAIPGFHFADKRLSQLPTPQAAKVVTCRKSEISFGP